MCHYPIPPSIFPFSLFLLPYTSLSLSLLSLFLLPYTSLYLFLLSFFLLPYNTLSLSLLSLFLLPYNTLSLSLLSLFLLPYTSLSLSPTLIRMASFFGVSGLFISVNFFLSLSLCLSLSLSLSLSLLFSSSLPLSSLHLPIRLGSVHQCQFHSAPVLLHSFSLCVHGVHYINYACTEYIILIMRARSTLY